MIDLISSWASGIVVSIIIATLLELILPEGKNKKYIKMVIGMYILFSVVSPIINVFIGNDISMASYFNIENYINSEQIDNEAFSVNTDNSIEEIYMENIEADLKGKMLEKGYEILNADLKIETGEENYGIIRYMNLQIRKKEKEDNSIKSINSIEEVKININKNENISKEIKNNISQEEIKEIKEYLSITYDVKLKNIIINNM